MALFPATIQQGSSSDSRLGYYYKRDNSTIEFTKTPITNGITLENPGSWGGVAFIEHDGTVALASPASSGGYGIIRTDGTSDGNLKTTVSVHRGDIILLTISTRVTITW